MVNHVIKLQYICLVCFLEVMPECVVHGAAAVQSSNVNNSDVCSRGDAQTLRVSTNLRLSEAQL
jgi:hypothetical protein